MVIPNQFSPRITFNMSICYAKNQPPLRIQQRRSLNEYTRKHHEPPNGKELGLVAAFAPTTCQGSRDHQLDTFPTLTFLRPNLWPFGTIDDRIDGWYAYYGFYNFCSMYIDFSVFHHLQIQLRPCLEQACAPPSESGVSRLRYQRKTIWKFSSTAIPVPAKVPMRAPWSRNTVWRT